MGSLSLSSGVRVEMSVARNGSSETQGLSSFFEEFLVQFRKDDEKFFLTATFNTIEEWECHMVIKKCQASKSGYEYFTFSLCDESNLLEICKKMKYNMTIFGK